MSKEQLERVMKQAGAVLKAESPAAAQDVASLGKLLLGAFPGFVATAEKLADLSSGVRQFIGDLPKMVNSVVSAMNDKFEVKPATMSEPPRGVSNIGRELAKALRRLRRSVDDRDLQNRTDDVIEMLESLDDLADALRNAEDGDRVDVALPKKARHGGDDDGGNGERVTSADGKGTGHRRRLHDILKRYGIDPGVSSLAQVLPIEEMCQAIITDKEALPVVVWEAEAPSGVLPALKVPDPRFLVERLEDEKVAGLLSRRRRVSRVDKPQALVNEVAPSGLGRALVWAVVSQEEPLAIKNMTELTDAQRAGIDKLTAEEFSTEEDIFFIPLKLVVIFEPPLRLKQPPKGRRFGSEVDFDNDIEKGRQLSIEQLLREQRRKEIHGFVDDPDPSALRRVTDSKLKQMDRELHDLFKRSFSDTDVTAAEGVSREDVINAHVFVLRELDRRDIDTVETDQLAEETVPFMGDELTKGEGRFARVNSGSGGGLEPIALEQVLSAFEKPMGLRMPAVFAVGSICNHGVTKNDIDLLIRGPFSEELRQVIQFRLGRALDPEMSQRVQFLDDVHGGPFTSNVPLYDLVLVPHEDRTVKEMAAEETAKQDDPMMDWPPKPGKLPAVLQFHFRGKTLHADLRLKIGDHLVGWTIALQKAGAVPKVDTLEDARKIASAFKLEGSRYTKDMRLPARLFATPKSRQPLVWLSIGDTVFEPGEVGATRNEAGVYVEVATPKVEWGLQKPSSHEYFLTGEDGFAGTLAFRLLVGEGGRSEGHGAGEAFWTAGFTKSALPSVLKRRSVNTKSMPPLGHSAMPQSLMRATPKEFRFWEADSEAEARKVRDALVDAKLFTESNVVVDGGEYRRTEQKVLVEAYDPEDGEVAKGALADFALSWQWWKGQTVVRAAPSRQVWHLLIAGLDGVDRAVDFQLQKDPLSGEEAITALRIEGGTDSDQALKFEGDVEPGKDVEGLLPNDTKNTPSHVAVQDRGKVEFLDDEANLKRVRFRGKKLKGIFTLVREEAGSDLWQLSPGDDPGRAVPGEDEKLEKGRPITEGELAEFAKAHETRSDGTQVWDPAKVKDGDDRGGEREELRPPAIFQPMKPAPRDSVAFTDPDKASGEVFSDQLIRQGVQVEPKYNGFRGVAERWPAGDEETGAGTMVFTEDSKRDIADNLKGLTEELNKVGDDFVLDGEFMAVDDAGNFLPRRELAAFRGGSPVDDSNLRFVVFDALYLSGNNITAEPMAQRRRLLDRWWKSKVAGKGLDRLVLGPRRIAKTRSALRRAIEWASKQPGSEGAMLKHLTATYTLGGEQDLLAKVKAVREVKALVLDRESVEGRDGVFNFGCAIGPVSKSESEQWKETVEHDGKLWVKIGRTGNRKLDAKPGDVLLVQVLEILWEEGPPNRVRWFGPAQALEVIESRPSTLKDVKDLLVDGEYERRGGAEKLAKFAKTERRFRIVKSEKKGDERYVFGVVLVPNEPDAQGDIYDEHEVEKACHSFLEHFGGRIKIMHRGKPVDGVIPIENYVAKQAETHGDETFPMGTWFLATRVKNDEVWQDVQDGAFTGYSMGGTALREALSPEQP